MRLPRQPRFWLAAFLLWFVALCVMSSFTLPAVDRLPPIRHLDKLEHFGYFFIGGVLLCAFFHRRHPAFPQGWVRIAVATVVIALIGWLDEWHQTFTLGRSGNDPYDWLADLLGGAAGAWFFDRLRRLRSGRPILGSRR